MPRTLVSKIGRSGYERIDATENPENIRGICESRQTPGAKGDLDRHYWQDRMLSMGFSKNDPTMPVILAQAKAAGIETAGKIYVGGLARPGMGGADPMAWVADVSDLRTSAKLQRKNLAGSTTVKSFDPDDTPDDKPVPLAPDLLEEMMRMELAKNPDWQKDMEGLREYVIATYATPDYSTVE